MAERKSVNKYYPPDWDPSKGSINNYVGQHPLRDRAKKLHQGILVIRFEMPYNIWCGGCNAHIGMGVRYNAEKTKTGNYYSTPIYKFRMKCHLCDNYFEIQTDPKNHDYVILEGARRKEQRWDPKENEQIVPEDKATQKKLATDAMFKLEHGTDDRQKGKKAVSSLAQLETSKEGMKDDYILNKMARNKFREEKKSLKKIQDDDNALLKKSSLEIPLVEERESDVKLAGLIRLRAVESLCNNIHQNNALLKKSSLEIPLIDERKSDVKLAGLFRPRAVETYDEKQVQKRKEIDSRPIFQSKKRRRSDESNSPQAKKFKIITDNIRKAKASSTSSPFDRMRSSFCQTDCLKNSSMLGVGLTKDLLGIRKKSTHASKTQDKQCDSTSNDSFCDKEIENGDCVITVPDDKDLENSDKEGQISESQNQTELRNNITRLEYPFEIRNDKDKKKDVNLQLDIQPDKDEDVHKDSIDSSRNNYTNTNLDTNEVHRQELANNQSLEVLDKMDMDKNTSESKGVQESNKTSANPDKDIDKNTSESTVVHESDKTLDNVNTGAPKDDADCNTNDESTITTKPRLSLVAAYSDSEDTDASTD